MTEPRQLAHADSSGDWIYRLFAWMHRITPLSIYAWAAQTILGPERAARVVSFLPPQSLPSIVKALPNSFSAQVAPHLPTEIKATLVEVLPVETLVDITRELCVAKDYATAASFGQLFTVARIKALVVALNDADSIAHMTQYFDSETLTKFAQAFSGPYLTRLADALDRNNYHRVEAELGAHLNMEHLVSLAKGLKPAQVARFLIRFNEQKLQQVLAVVTDDKRNAVVKTLFDERIANYKPQHR